MWIFFLSIQTSFVPDDADLAEVHISITKCRHHPSIWLILLLIAALFLFSISGYNSSTLPHVFTSSSFVWKFSWTEVVYCMMCMWTTGINFHNFPTHDVFFIHVSAAALVEASIAPSLTPPLAPSPQKSTIREHLEVESYLGIFKPFKIKTCIELGLLLTLAY